MFSCLFRRIKGFFITIICVISFLFVQSICTNIYADSLKKSGASSYLSSSLLSKTYEEKEINYSYDVVRDQYFSYSYGISSITFTIGTGDNHVIAASNNKGDVKYDMYEYCKSYFSIDYDTGDFTISSLLDAGNYSCMVYFMDSGNEDYRPIELPVVFHVTVNKLEQSYNAGVINSTLTYDASEMNLASGGSADNGTFYYGISQSSTVEPSSWSENAPKAINAGSYYIWYKVVGNTNYKDVNPTYLGEAIIQKSSNLNVDFSNQSFSTTYYHSEIDHTSHSDEIVIAEANAQDEQLSYSLLNYTEYFNINSDNGKLAVYDNTPAGNYILNVEAKTLDSSNYDVSKIANITIEVKKREMSIELPNLNLLYNGQEQDILNDFNIQTGDESSFDGTIKFALGNNSSSSPNNASYSTSHIKATEPGDYYIWYSVTPNSSNYSSVSNSFLCKVNIKKQESNIIEENNKLKTVNKDMETKIKNNDIVEDEIIDNTDSANENTIFNNNGKVINNYTDNNDIKEDTVKINSKNDNSYTFIIVGSIVLSAIVLCIIVKLLLNIKK